MRVDLPSGIHLNVHSRGSGASTALLIHGWAVCGDIWSPVLDAWPADGPRLLAPDLRGTGWSSKPQDGYTLENYAADIVALIDKLELRDLVLVGHSMGGTIAMKVALARPQNLRRLVLISPVPAGGVPFKDEEIGFFRSLGGSQAGSEQVLAMMMARRPSQAAYERAVVGMGSVAEEAFFGGFDAWLADPHAGVLRIDTPLVKCEINIADVGHEDQVFEAGGIRRQIRVFRLPDENPHQQARISRRIPLQAKDDNALYVCLTQEDGHLVWSSPIYVTR